MGERSRDGGEDTEEGAALLPLEVWRCVDSV